MQIYLLVFSFNCNFFAFTKQTAKHYKKKQFQVVTESNHLICENEDMIGLAAQYMMSGIGKY